MRRIKQILALGLICALGLGLCACGKAVGSYRVLKTLGSESFRIGFRQNDYVATYVDAALKALAADGTVHSLAIKWLGTDETTIEADSETLEALGDIPQRELIVGVSDSSFPMSYADGDGYAGFDVELAQAVGQKLGWTVRYQPISVSDAYVELSSGNVDCVWGGMVLDGVNLDENGKEKAEKQRIALSEPYLTNELLLVTRADSKYSSASRLKGATVMLDTDEQYMAALQANERLMNRFGQVERVTGGAQQCFDALNAGECAAIVTDSVTLAYYTH